VEFLLRYGLENRALASSSEVVSQLDKNLIPGEPNPVSSTGQVCGSRPFFVKGKEEYDPKGFLSLEIVFFPDLSGLFNSLLK